MAKLKSDKITQPDLIEFLDDHSDFAFEINVLNALIGKGLACEHCGSYTDAATGKTREFDIRATWNNGLRFLRLAVECKNIREYFPLLVSCMPRREAEAFHEVSASVDPEKFPLEEPEPYAASAFMKRSEPIRLNGNLAFYKPEQTVGKSCQQVGRSRNSEIYSTGSDIYTKWEQALSSAHDLTRWACEEGEEIAGGLALSVVIPIVVVPTGRLWKTEFDSCGKRTADPQVTDRCSYFVGQLFHHGNALVDHSLTISHIEFVTPTGLSSLVDEICSDAEHFDKSFSINHALGILTGSS